MLLKILKLKQHSGLNHYWWVLLCVFKWQLISVTLALTVRVSSLAAHSDVQAVVGPEQCKYFLLSVSVGNVYHIDPAYKHVV